MYTAGIVTLIVCLAFIILFAYLSEREMSEDACVFLGIIISVTLLLGSFWRHKARMIEDMSKERLIWLMVN